MYHVRERERERDVLKFDSIEREGDFDTYKGKCATKIGWDGPPPSPHFFPINATPLLAACVDWVSARLGHCQFQI